jgi:lysophospholipase L1-like esterase
MSRRWLIIVTLTIGLSALAFGGAFGQSPQLLEEDATRYMVLGDSIAAGYKAQPATNGFAYRLYNMGVFDRLPHTLFCNAAVPGATSADVLAHQVPQALILFDDGGFNPKYIVMTVGGNDLLSILRGADPPVVLNAFALNLYQIFYLLTTDPDPPAAKLFVGNLYLIPELEELFPGAGLIIQAFNGIVSTVAGYFPGQVFVVDIYTSFQGRNGLFLVDRHGASPTEVHLTNAGHAAMAKAFAGVIQQNK